jgi:basic amino acid/polyamine antiporter, APA family
MYSFSFATATGTFFGYLGYDQVCSLAGEAQDAKRNLPRAILWVLAGVTTLYMTATLALTGMRPYADISPVSGFPSAFRDVNAIVASQITAMGEIVTLPIVILTCLMAQPRLMYGMSVDGLLPPMFQQVDTKGTLVNGTIVAGAIMTLVAAFIPFVKLNDMISGAVLLALNMTDSSVILLWHMNEDEEEESSSTSTDMNNPNHSSSTSSSSWTSSSSLANRLMLCFHIAALVASVSFSWFSDSLIGLIVGVVAIAIDIFACYALWRWCPRAKVFGGRHRYHYHQDELKIVDEGYFECPFVPALPCFAILCNWYLIAQLDFLGVTFLLGFLLLATIYYFAYAAKHSVGNNIGWEVHPAPSNEYISDGIELQETNNHQNHAPVPLTSRAR